MVESKYRPWLVWTEGTPSKSLKDPILAELNLDGPISNLADKLHVLTHTDGKTQYVIIEEKGVRRALLYHGQPARISSERPSRVNFSP